MSVWFIESTLAWGVNTPARLVIVKGTEFFDGKTSRYVDYPLTDVLQVSQRWLYYAIVPCSIYSP